MMGDRWQWFKHGLLGFNLITVLAEPVEAFSSQGLKERKGFDRLSPNGIGAIGGKEKAPPDRSDGASFWSV